MKKQTGCFLFLLCLSGLCTAQQVVTSGGHAKESDATVEWIIGGILADISGLDVINLTSDQLKQLMESDFTFHIFPNPASEILNVEITPSDSCRMLIEVIDLQGRTLMLRAKVMEPVIHLDIKDLDEGAYYIRITQPTDNRLLEIKKIIKIKK
ncbi:MAG: T9SS type A sorting domain-containing protein [Bacteroidales bacterium]|jgi:hypothetical protein|nr:T9SS type A sorting domain-containing protein [Bacteroidales bacterium]